MFFFTHNNPTYFSWFSKNEKTKMLSNKFWEMYYKIIIIEYYWIIFRSNNKIENAMNINISKALYYRLNDFLHTDKINFY